MRAAIAVVSVALGLATAGCGGGGAGPGGGGTLFYSQEGNANGLFILDLATGTATPVGAGNTGVVTDSVGLTEAPGGLIGSTQNDIGVINPNGSAANVLPGTESAEGLAFHATDGRLYAAINGVFKALDSATGLLITNLSAPGVDLEGLASDAVANRIYGVGESPNLQRYDVATDTWSVVGPTGLADMNDAGLAFDPGTRVLYAITAGTLYRIDPATGAATPIGPTGLAGGGEGGLGFVAH